MRPDAFTVLLLALSLAACAGRPVRDMSRSAGSIEIPGTTGQPAADGDRRVQAGSVAAAGGVGAAAGLACGPMAIVCSPVFGLATAAGVAADIAIGKLLDQPAATRARALAEQLQAMNASGAFIADIASRVRETQVGATRVSWPALRLDLEVSRLELQPRFPAQVQLLVWVEARMHCADARCGAMEARQRYVHLGDYINLRDLESDPDLLSRHIALSQEQLARQIGRDLRR